MAGLSELVDVKGDSMQRLVGDSWNQSNWELWSKGVAMSWNNQGIKSRLATGYFVWFLGEFVEEFVG